MKIKFGLLLLILFYFPIIINGQTNMVGTQIPMLEFNPDPQSFGLGSSGVSMPSNDALGFYYNPALLGYSAHMNNLSFQIYPGQIKWYGSHYYTSDISGLNIGYNFSKLLNGLNLSAGLGFISNTYNYISPVFLPGSDMNIINSRDKYTAMGIGVSLDYYVNISLGFTIKNITSQIPVVYSSSTLGHLEAKLNALDWGIFLNIPVSKLAFTGYEYKPVKQVTLIPEANLSLGYSRSNIGSNVNYHDGMIGEQLPLAGRLGYTFSIGEDIKFNDHPINFITYDFTAEAEDILIGYNNHTLVYQGLLGDIKFWNNLIDLKRTNNVTLRKSQKLNVFDTYSYLYGSYYTPEISEISNRTNGFILSTNGLFKLLSWNFGNNPYLNFFLDHIEINYVNATSVNKSSIGGFNMYSSTNIKAISVSFNRFTF